MKVSRRTFLKGLAAAGAAGAATSLLSAEDAYAAVSENSYATLIDLTKCDGCVWRDMPACVEACRTANAHKFPEPDPEMLKPYWPQPKFEDWSDKRHITSRLTPYNWIFVQKVSVTVDGQQTEVHVPRRCMHCDNPPCVKLCPFGSNIKTLEGPVYINENLCMGGAKCRDVCPWSVPQRQAGVGPYTAIDPVPAGGGVMYKCDLCRDRLQQGQEPACMEQCPNNAMLIGTRSEIYARAEELREQYDGYIYGKAENGGTSTLYVSAVPFEAIDEAITAQAEQPEKTMRMHNPENMLSRHVNWKTVVLAAPLVGALGAFTATLSKDAKSTKNTTPDTITPENQPESQLEQELQGGSQKKPEETTHEER
jgi:formate dehydrogenase iron-sulfur subunit